MIIREFCILISPTSPHSLISALLCLQISSGLTIPLNAPPSQLCSESIKLQLWRAMHRMHHWIIISQCNSQLSSLRAFSSLWVSNNTSLLLRIEDFGFVKSQKHVAAHGSDEFCWRNRSNPSGWIMVCIPIGLARLAFPRSNKKMTDFIRTCRFPLYPCSST